MMFIIRVTPKKIEDKNRIAKLMDKVIAEFNEYYNKTKWGFQLKLGPIKIGKRKKMLKDVVKIKMGKIVAKESIALYIETDRKIDGMTKFVLENIYKNEMKKLLKENNIEYKKIEVVGVG